MTKITINGWTPDTEKAAFIADNATLVGNVVMEEESSVWFGAVVRADNNLIHIGKGSNIQENSSIHVESNNTVEIGEGVTIGHCVVLHGCKIGDNSLIGMHSTILDNAEIGKNCIVGAHSLVTGGKVFPDGSLIMGVPAKLIRPLTPEEIERNKHAAEHYKVFSSAYKEAVK